MNSLALVDALECAARVHRPPLRSPYEVAAVDAAEHRLTRSVMVVDDSPTALLALLDALHGVGAPLHAVTHDSDASLSRALHARRASVHHTGSAGYATAPTIWRALRSAIVVTDLCLDGTTTGLGVLYEIGLGPRSVLVTSRDDRDMHPEMVLDCTLAVVARRIGALAVLRDPRVDWQAQLRGAVESLLRDVPSEPS